MAPGSERVAISVPQSWFLRAVVHAWTWLKRNLDTMVALLVAAIISTLDQLSSVDPSTTNNAILVVLGLLAYAAMRDRSRDDARDEALATTAQQTGQEMARVSAELHTISGTLAGSAEVQVLHGDELRRDLTASRNGARTWLYRGGTGKFIRAVTLPHVVDQARAGAHELYIRLEILDPTDAAVCERYVLYRMTQADDTVKWDRRRVEHECYATILACCWHWHRYPRLRPEIGLSRIVRTMRWELSDDALFITQENPFRPALKVPHGRVLYDYARTELDISFDHSRHVDLSPGRSVRLGVGDRDPTHTEMRQLFSALRLPLPATYDDADLDDIVKRALHTESAHP